MASRILLLLLFASLALSQSEVAGDIGASAPYGIPADTFGNLTSNPTLQGTYSIGGFNISNATYQQIDGWRLNVAVTADVPLTDAQAAGINTSQVTETTVMSLLAPPSVTTFNQKVWKLCTIIFPYVNMTATATSQKLNETSSSNRTAAANGTVENCESFLGDDCWWDIKMIGGRAGMDECPHISVPSSCTPYFGGENWSTSFFVDGDAMEDGRIYAWGSEPTNTNNQSAIVAAENQGWPIVFVWMNENGLYSFPMCVQASNGSSTPPSGTSHPTPSVSTRNMAQVRSVVLAVAVAALL